MLLLLKATKTHLDLEPALAPCTALAMRLHIDRELPIRVKVHCKNRRSPGGGKKLPGLINNREPALTQTTLTSKHPGTQWPPSIVRPPTYFYSVY